MKPDILEKEYRGRKYHIIGIGRSGVNSANLLLELGAQVTLSDKKEAGELGDYLSGVKPGIGVMPGRQDRELVSGIDCLVLSPGVPTETDIARTTRSAGAEVIGEIELSYRIIRDIAAASGMKVRWFGITGTNGKSTTTALLFEILKKAGKNCLLGGNIGIPLSGETLKLLGDFRKDIPAPDLDIVLELSSFQLETMRDFRLDGSALLNITDDHLDRYRDLEEYASAKAAVFMNQGQGDYAVINADDQLAIRHSEGCRGRKYFVSTVREVHGCYSLNGSVCINTGYETDPLIENSDIKIIGVHNRFNAMTASLMAFLAGVPRDVITSVLKEFPGLEHRIEFAGEKNGVRFYNDSKGTNVGAVIKSLESFDDGIILIAGGRDKNSDFSQLVPYLGPVKKIFLIGEAADKIGQAVGDSVPIEKTSSLSEAVLAAYRSGKEGDTVLLSPACASFDMFRNYEDRGRQFKEIVRALLRDGGK